MENLDITHHISQQFNAELEDVRNRVLSMGGFVEQQIQNALSALADSNNLKLAEEVLNSDWKANSMERTIDEECTQIIARRQPAASDLRLVITVLKTITDLERIGDEAEKIARMSVHTLEDSYPKRFYVEIAHLGNHVSRMLKDTLDAFARLDVESALAVVQEEPKVDREYDALMRQLITFMMEDPRNITRVLNIMWAARALERIGDHTRNICEYIIYMVKGKDVRHTSLDQLERTVLGEPETPD